MESAGVEAVVVNEEEEEEEGDGMSANRCFAFVATMERSSGKVTWRERRRGQASC